MRRLLLGLILAALSVAATPAWAGHGHRWGHWHGGWHHHHWHGHHWHGGWGHRPWIGWGGGYYYGGPRISISLGYRPYCGSYAYQAPLCYPAYGACYSPSTNYVDYFVDSSYEPAELAYGPLAVKQFLGLDRNFALGPLRQPASPLLNVPLLNGSLLGRSGGQRITAADLAKAPVDGATVRLKVRKSNPESRRRAERYLAQGDELFEQQKWNSALQRYKSAALLAPDVAECYWRQGHALIAVNQHDQAAAAFRRALLLSDDTRRGGFELNDLYGTSAAAKNSHLETLAGRALATSISPEPYFLIGITLYYDGEVERSRKFFERAAELSSGEGEYLAGFLVPNNGTPDDAPRVVPVVAEEWEI